LVKIVVGAADPMPIGRTDIAPALDPSAVVVEEKEEGDIDEVWTNAAPNGLWWMPTGRKALAGGTA